MADSTNSHSTTLNNPFLLIGIGVLVGLLLAFVWNQRVSSTTANVSEPLTNEDRVLGKWELNSDSELLGRRIGTEFEFIKGGNVNTSSGVLQFSFPDPEHIKLTDGLSSAITNFSFDGANIVLQAAGQSPITLAPLAITDVTQEDLIGTWAFFRRVGHDEPCIDLRDGDSFNEMTFDTVGPRSIMFNQNGTIAIWRRQFLFHHEVYEKPVSRGRYYLKQSRLVINATSDTGLVNPINTACTIQKTNTKLILGSEQTGAILHLIRTDTP